jgi:hypothetical protein
MRFIFIFCILIVINNDISSQNSFDKKFERDFFKTIKSSKYIHYVFKDTLGNTIYKIQGPVIRNSKNRNTFSIENNFYCRKYFYDSSNRLTQYNTINYGTNPMKDIIEYDNKNRIIKINHYFILEQLNLLNTIKFLINTNINQTENFNMVGTTTYFYTSDLLTNVTSLSNVGDTIDYIKYIYKENRLSAIYTKDFLKHKTEIDIYWNEIDNLFPNYCLLKTDFNNTKILFHKKNDSIYYTDIINMKSLSKTGRKSSEIIFNKNKMRHEMKGNGNVFWENNYYYFLEYLYNPRFLE